MDTPSFVVREGQFDDAFSPVYSETRAPARGMGMKSGPHHAKSSTTDSSSAGPSLHAPASPESRTPPAPAPAPPPAPAPAAVAANGSGSVSNNTNGQKWIWVLDPLTRKLRVPMHLLVPTQATAITGTVPSLCMGFLEGRCRHQWCRQAHVLPQAIAQLRHDALHAPTCCKEHLDPHDISPLTNRYTHIRIVHYSHANHHNNNSNTNTSTSNHSNTNLSPPSLTATNGAGSGSASSNGAGLPPLLAPEEVPDLDELIPTSRVANTVGLLRYLVHIAPPIKRKEDEEGDAGEASDLPMVPEGGSAQMEGEGSGSCLSSSGKHQRKGKAKAQANGNAGAMIRVLDLPSKCVCRLHLSHRCRYLEDCNNIHICREYEERIPPPPNVLSQLLHIQGHTKEVLINDVLYEVTPLALGEVSDEDFQYITEVHREEFMEKRNAATVAGGMAEPALLFPAAPAGSGISPTGNKAQTLSPATSFMFVPPSFTVSGTDSVAAGPPEEGPLGSDATVGAAALLAASSFGFLSATPMGAGADLQRTSGGAGVTGPFGLQAEGLPSFKAESVHSASSSHSSSPNIYPSASSANGPAAPAVGSGPSFRVHDLLSRHYAHCTTALLHHHHHHGSGGTGHSGLSSSQRAASSSPTLSPSLSPVIQQRHNGYAAGRTPTAPPQPPMSSLRLPSPVTGPAAAPSSGGTRAAAGAVKAGKAERGRGVTHHGMSSANEYTFRVHADPLSASLPTATSSSNQHRQTPQQQPGQQGGKGNGPRYSGANAAANAVTAGSSNTQHNNRRTGGGTSHTAASSTSSGASGHHRRVNGSSTAAGAAASSGTQWNKKPLSCSSPSYVPPQPHAAQTPPAGSPPAPTSNLHRVLDNHSGSAEASELTSVMRLNAMGSNRQLLMEEE